MASISSRPQCVKNVKYVSHSVLDMVPAVVYNHKIEIQTPMKLMTFISVHVYTDYFVCDIMFLHFIVLSSTVMNYCHSLHKVIAATCCRAVMIAVYINMNKNEFNTVHEDYMLINCV